MKLNMMKELKQSFMELKKENINSNKNNINMQSYINEFRDSFDLSTIHY